MITLSPMQASWLKSICEDGPTCLCTEAVASKLVRQGLANRNAEQKLEASDLGRSVVRALNGEPSTIVRVKA